MKSLLVLVLAMSLSGCSMVSKWMADEPKVHLKRVVVQHMSMNKVSLAFEAEVENPNSFELGLDRIDYDVLLRSKTIGRGEFEGKFRVPGKSTKTLQVPFNLDTKSALKVAQQMLLRGGPLMVQVRGSVVFSTPLGSFTSVFDEQKELLKK